jgi:antitoxin (DNA-binding transcriptional repressor) of toxin-antitoxin stability system
MDYVTVHKAKTELSKLIEKSLAGEKVVIAKGKTPVVELSPVAQKPSIFRGYGALKHLGPLKIDFFEPLSEDELAAWEGKYSFDP